MSRRAAHLPILSLYDVQALLLWRRLGYPFKRIAEGTGLPLSLVKSRIYRPGLAGRQLELMACWKERKL